MTGKKALARLKADPALVAKNTPAGAMHRPGANYDARWRDGHIEWRGPTNWYCGWWDPTHDQMHWTLYRVKAKLRDVWKEPRVGDLVQSCPHIVGSESCEGSTLKVLAVDDAFVMLEDVDFNDADWAVIDVYTRAEFAARALPPFSWAVFARAE